MGRGKDTESARRDAQARDGTEHGTHVLVPGYRAKVDVDAILKKMRPVLESGQLAGGGAICQELERQWAERTVSAHAVSVNSGESALDIALRFFRSITPERPYVAVAGVSFCGDVAAILRAGFVPFYVDVDDSMQMSFERLKALAVPHNYMGLRIAGVLPVHIGGYVNTNMLEMKALCHEQGWFLLEDACHAHGATLRGVPAGHWGDAAVFSFFGTKVITSGEGGMLVTSRDDVAKFARAARQHGLESLSNPSPIMLSGNYRMPEVAAVVASVETQRLDQILDERRQVAQVYDQALAGQSDLWPLRVPGCEPSYYKYVVQCASEAICERARDYLTSRGVGLGGLVYHTPVYTHSVFASQVDLAAFLPNSERWCRSHLCLPMYSGVDCEYVAGVLEEMSL